MTEHRPAPFIPVGLCDETTGARGDGMPGVAGATAPGMHPSGAVADVLATRAEQIDRYGHTPERDARRPLLHFAQDIENAARAILEDAQFNKDPARIRRRLVRLAALTLAAIDRIDNHATAHTNEGDAQ